MLSNNKILLKILFISLIIISACSKEKEKINAADELKKLESKEYLLQKVKNVLGNDVGFTVKGNFNNNGVFEVVAAKDVNNSELSGIKFYLLQLNGSNLTLTDSTKILEGSLKYSLTNKIKFPFFNFELIYYNSKDYYLGSGGGEQFSYIINFNDNEIYYAHLISVPKKVDTIFLSNNIKNEQIKNFFLSIAKKDFPNINVSSTDIKLDKNSF
ncbi:MAG: hypothetical protein COW08_01750 [Ignavibacteriales bacterium CG12_big_fil_rev_8_21_14_0_65_30_8]|nr:MAG: hypothetical protein COW08_01750 [Ignavibacteriales bacterium CG12_big_fil_rev_8_21_14_0_65_30_8]